jgi:hypothetical protein
MTIYSSYAFLPGGWVLFLLLLVRRMFLNPESTVLTIGAAYPLSFST